MSKSVYEKMVKCGHTRLAVLVDPDKQTEDSLMRLIQQAENCKADFFFVGGSLLVKDAFEKTVKSIKQQSKLPVVIFPGNNYQLSNEADAILLLSLISGRNAEYLIGQHVAAAAALKKSKLEIIPTGYMLIDGGRISTTSYITQTVPIPADKTDVAVATALAGEMLGMKAIYLEAGSGAHHSVSAKMIKQVKQNIAGPLIVGGGIKTGEQAEEISRAGADIIVIGNILEKEPEALMEIALGVKWADKSSL
ncbi:MAG: geranylgeranylglyceryl/heptaprenylglyceryl phosphate synthase [Chitinophagales bacterium]